MENQTNQPQQPAAAPQAAAPAPAQGNGMAIASMVLGIVAFLTGLIYLGAILGILAIIFGIIALKKKAGKGMAITGIVTGSLGLLATILVFVLVFAAVPSLQESARDTSRKQEIGLALSGIAYYQSENRGALPDASYLGESYSPVTLKYVSSGEPTTDTAVYVVGENCAGVKSARAYSVSVKLESGKIYCQDS